MTAVRDLSLIQAFAAAVKARRHALGISQEELAWRAGVDRTFVARIELAQNQPSLSVLFALGNGLNTPVDDLIKDTVRRHKTTAKLTLTSPLTA